MQYYNINMKISIRVEDKYFQNVINIKRITTTRDINRMLYSDKFDARFVYTIVLL